MDRRPTRPEDKAIIGLSHETPDGVPVAFIGIPPAAWDYMLGGLCHDFDLTKAGINAKVVIFRGKDQAECVRILSSGPGGAPKMMSGDFAIDDEGKKQ